MEDFVPAVGASDESNLSTTQELDPSVYARFLQQAVDGRRAASPETALLRIGATQDNGPTSTGTERSYAVNQTGHITLDYQPPPPFEDTAKDSFEDAANGEASSQPTGIDMHLMNPQTPAQPKLILAQPGSIMGLSQMFEATQPSPGSRARQNLLPSASKPSPDMFGNQQLPRGAASSPLIWRGVTVVPITPAELASSSSPVRWSPAPIANQPRTTRQPLPELLNDYRSRKESQELRLQHARELEEEIESSDDGFSDIGAERNRLAKRRRQKAARELAMVGTARPTSSPNNPVEVPSTSNGRRRSLADDYRAQCSGFDARDSQQDDIVADSQAPLESPENDRLDGSHRDLQNGRKDCELEAPTSSGRVFESEISEQLPGLDQTEDLDATESERESSEPPPEPAATCPLDEMSSNIAQLRTPAVQKVIYSDADTRIPETSPMEPHIQRYGEIISQTPPILSAEGLDDSYNPLTQDEEYIRLMKSPTPQGRIQPMKTKLSKPADRTALQRASGFQEAASVVETADPEPVNDLKNSAIAKEAETSSTCLRGTSEYVTAPTSLPNEKMEPFAVPSSTENMDWSGIEQAAADDKAESSQGESPLVERPELPSSPVLFQDELQAEAAKVGSGIATPEKVLTSQANATAETFPKCKPIGTSRHAKRLAVQTSEDPVKPMLPSASPDASQSGLRMLRSASQLRGHARLTRHSTGHEIASPTTTSSRGGAKSKQSIWLSTPAAILPDELALGNDPEAEVATSVSARRKTTQNIPAERSLFEGMAFSVSYVSREREKQNVLRLIEQNGGLILTLGFDELFDMPAIKQASPRNAEAGGNIGRCDLILTPEAQKVGFACLIADEHSRRVKYMHALALGLPCISGLWIEHCVDKGMIVDWDSYLLPAGESRFLRGAVRNRNLQPYPAITSKFSERFNQRPTMLAGKAILLVMSRRRVEERKKTYTFLAQALGAKQVMLVHNNPEARKFLLGAEAEGKEWDWVYVDENEKDADSAIFGRPSAPKKRKRGSTAHEETDDQGQVPKRVKIVTDEYVIQSLILGKLLEET